MASGKKGGEGPITIKKYANRRLYNTATSSYVTLEHLRDMAQYDEAAAYVRRVAKRLGLSFESAR